MADAICSVEGCGRPHKARGWCYRHYRQWWNKNRDDAAASLAGKRRDPLSLIDTDGPNGCWLWVGSIGKKGYGCIFIDRKRHEAHRLVYELLVEPIPDGLEIDHLCRVHACVNPDHLEPVTKRENLRRAHEFRIAQPGGDQCARGHLLAGDNLYRRPSRPNSRECRACRQSYKK